MPKETEGKTVERVVENITFCHFQDTLFTRIRRTLHEALGWSEACDIKPNARILLVDSDASIGHYIPDKYLESVRKF